MKWKGVIFDRDGTLFDSFPVILSAFNYAIEPFTDQRPSDEQWFAAFGPSEPEVISKFIPVANKREATDRFFRCYKERSADVHLFPGIMDVLKRLKESGCKIGLFTGGGRESTRLVLERSGVAGLFDVLITGDDVVRHKPHPEGITTAISRMNVEAPSTLVVGDAGADMIAGQKAGVKTGLARWAARTPPYDLPSRPDYTFYSVADFERFLFQKEKATEEH
jgi:HAD superfamily hydrolase (TIGR01549 family)